MSAYTPDRWVIVKVTPANEPSHYRVLAGWYGGYTSGDSWKLNSGIVGWDDTGDHYDVRGSSGSVYRCHKASSGLSGYMASVLDNLQRQIETTGGSISVVDDYFATPYQEETNG